LTQSSFGLYYDTAKEAILTDQFHGVQLMNGSKPTIPEILQAQFYQSLADNMRTRLLTTSTSRITTAKAASEDASSTSSYCLIWSYLIHPRGMLIRPLSMEIRKSHVCVDDSNSMKEQLLMDSEISVKVH